MINILKLQFVHSSVHIRSERELYDNSFEAQRRSQAVFWRLRHFKKFNNLTEKVNFKVIRVYKIYFIS